MKASRILVCFEKHAQDGRGVERPVRMSAGPRPGLAACSRALCVFEKHAQDGLGIERPARMSAWPPPGLAARIRALCAFGKHAQDGLGVERPPEELRSVAPLMAARIRALCAFEKHAQDGLGIRRPPEELRSVSPLRAARIRALCALPFALSTLFASSAESLRIKVIEGQDSVNHIKTMSAVQPSIQVFDAQGAPVNGAEVTFLLPSAGPGASFKGWLRSEVVETNQDGRATAVGLQPNREAGQFLIKVSAVSGSTRGSAMITQTNVLKEPKPPKQKREPLPCVRSVFGVCLERAEQCDGTGAKR